MDIETYKSFMWADCIPCIRKMALKIARVALKDRDKLHRFSHEVASRLQYPGMNTPTVTQPEIICDLLLVLERLSGTGDPLQEAKKRQNDIALELYPAAEEMARNSADPLTASLRIAIAGNAIDIMTKSAGTSPKQILSGLQNRRLNEDQLKTLCKRLKAARSIVYLGDNCGEVVFDKLFIQNIIKQYGTSITFVTRGLPALNDATLDDAISVGMDSVTPVTGNGAREPIPGTILGRVSSRCRQLIDSADLIISKGGGNFDTLMEEPSLNGRITFLIEAKCRPYCTIHRAERGDLIICNA